METEIHQRVISDEYGIGMEFVVGLEQCREKCLFVIEKYFIQPPFEEVTVIGKYKTEYSMLDRKNLCFVCGDVVIPAQRLSEGVYTAKLLPTYPGSVSFYLSIDSLIPASQVIKLKSPPKTKRSEIELQLEQRLVSLLLTNEKDREKLTRKLEETDQSEIVLRKYLKDWLFEGYRTSPIRDLKGQGVLHLFASLGYTWAISLYRYAGFKLNARDRSGWTALHWAAYYGRQGAATVLLYEGANPSILTKPTAEHPDGLSADNIASDRGHTELAAYLAEIVGNPKMIVSISAHLAETAGIKSNILNS